MTATPPGPPHTVLLPDGRTFAWYEYGDPAGLPCISVGGTPASGLCGQVFDLPARAAGVRWIAVDKPGYGHSSHDPERSLARFSSDVRHLLDHLGIERTAAEGESGGGPHVLALAHDLPDRITVAISVSGLGPASEPWTRDGMLGVNRLMLSLAGRAPWLLRLLMALTGRIAFRTESSFRAFLLRTLPPTDRDVLRSRPEVGARLFAAATGGLRQGSRGLAQEFTVFARPWHFELADVRVPVELWHGTEDRNVPFRIAQEVARRLPDGRLRVLDGEGHLAVYAHLEEILDSVVAAASALDDPAGVRDEEFRRPGPNA